MCRYLLYTPLPLRLVLSSNRRPSKRAKYAPFTCPKDLGTFLGDFFLDPKLARPKSWLRRGQKSGLWRWFVIRLVPLKAQFWPLWELFRPVLSRFGREWACPHNGQFWAQNLQIRTSPILRVKGGS